MNKQQLLQLVNESWLGRFRIYKPKKNEKLGIPYKPWHHLAIIDNYVFLYVWDTREIIDVYPLTSCNQFETTKVIDSGKPLLIGADTTQRAAKLIKEVLQKYEELPVINGSSGHDIKTIHDAADDAILDVDVENFDIHDDTQIIFVDKNAPIPENLYMYEEMRTINPNKRKFADNNAYAGIGKYFAILAHCAILKDWSELIQNSKQ